MKYFSAGLIILLLLQNLVLFCQSNSQFYDIEEYYIIYEAKYQHEIGNTSSCVETFDSLYRNFDYRSPIGITISMECYREMHKSQLSQEAATLVEKIDVLNYDRRYLACEQHLLRDSLIRILYEDQQANLSANYITSIEQYGLDHLLSQSSTITFDFNPKKHQDFVQNLINGHRNISKRDISYLGMKAMLIIILHSPHEFLQKNIEFVKQNYKSSEYAYAYDKLMVHKNNPQRYGTQSFYDESLRKEVIYPLESLSEIDSLRMTVNLEPLKYYKRRNNISN